jgi:hypothetical protein
MSNPRIPTARAAKPGMYVRQQALDLVPHAQDHQIEAVQRLQPGDINTECYAIRTNYGTWLFQPHELVTFPRRPDNSLRDWRGAAPPLPLQLAVGDILPPRWPHTSGQDPELTKQRVTAVTRNRTRPGIIQVTTYSEEDHVYAAGFLIDEPVIYPRPPSPERAEALKHARQSPTGYGPYQTSPESPSLYYLITHPTGRGQWPAYTANPIPIGPNVYLARPPTRTKINGKLTREPWPSFVGSNPYRRHPHDPYQGAHALVGFPADRLAEAEQIYADYLARTTAEPAAPEEAAPPA